MQLSESDPEEHEKRDEERGAFAAVDVRENAIEAKVTVSPSITSMLSPDWSGDTLFVTTSESDCTVSVRDVLLKVIADCSAT